MNWENTGEDAKVIDSVKGQSGVDGGDTAPEAHPGSTFADGMHGAIARWNDDTPAAEGH